MGLLQTNFSSAIERLSDTEKYIFYTFDNHPQMVKNFTLTELAEELNTSNTTIIRMTKKLEFSGFSAFKYTVERLISETSVLSHKNLLEQYQQFFNQSFASTNIADMEFIARKIHQAPSLYIIGVGLTKPVAEYVSKRFMQINKPTLYMYESHIIDLLSNFIKKDDVVLFLSMSGETKTLVAAAKKLHYSNNYIFSITNNGNSSLAQVVDRSLNSGVPINMYENYDITSRSFLMLQADLLFELYLKFVIKE